MRRYVAGLLSLSLGLVLAGGAQAQKKPQQEAMKSAPADAAAMIASALSAAPADIASGAAVMVPAADGKMTQLRAGTNGWACFPDDPHTPDSDPICVDRVWQEWVAALTAKRPPKIETVGISYMLQGSSDASNTDPFATKPAPGQHWLRSGPHLMMLVPNVHTLDAFPGEWSATGTYVMFKGTPYAHLMVPVR